MNSIVLDETLIRFVKDFFVIENAEIIEAGGSRCGRADHPGGGDRPARERRIV